MPQFLLLAAAAAIGIWGYKKFLNEAERVSKSVRRAEKEQANRAHGTLIEDPETGEYRPMREDELQK